MMVLSSTNTILSLGNVLLKTTAAAWTASFFLHMDCNPSLYWTEKCVSFQEKIQSLRTTTTTRPIDHSPSSRKRRRRRNVWIIGASSGIGEELAYQIADNANNQKQQQEALLTHLILSSRSQQRLEEIAKQCTNTNCQVTVIPFDICDEEEIRNSVQNVAKSIGCTNLLMTSLSSTTNDEENDNTLLLSPRNNDDNDHEDDNSDDETIVVMNAGLGHLSPALETSTQTAEQIWKCNALWPMIITPLLYEYNIFRTNKKNNQKHNRPHIVVTSSVAALMPVPLSACYSAAKHALHGYFRSFQTENPNVIVQYICPGPVDTDFHLKNKISGSDGDSTILKKKSPLKMSVERCARLMMIAMLYKTNSNSQQYWIASQPLLFGLYLEKFLPSSLLDRYLYGLIGPKRVELFKNGYDLYDPSSWKNARNNDKNDNNREG